MPRDQSITRQKFVEQYFRINELCDRINLAAWAGRRCKQFECKDHIGHDWEFLRGVYYCKRCRTGVINVSERNHAA